MYKKCIHTHTHTHIRARRYRNLHMASGIKKTRVLNLALAYEAPGTRTVCFLHYFRKEKKSECTCACADGLNSLQAVLFPSRALGWNGTSAIMGKKGRSPRSHGFGPICPHGNNVRRKAQNPKSRRCCMQSLSLCLCVGCFCAAASKAEGGNNPDLLYLPRLRLSHTHTHSPGIHVPDPTQTPVFVW